MKIALIAMSGIRAENPELMKLGLKLPGIFERAKTLFALICVFLCSLCVSCIIFPVRVPTRTKTPLSTERKTKIKVNFIQVGSTSRADVLNNLGWINTGIQEENFFWGRWTSSAWRWVWAVGAGGGGALGSNRVWGSHNLLVEFDEKGLVKSYSVFNDGAILKRLCATLTQRMREPLNLSPPIEIQVQHRHAREAQYEPAKLILDKESFEFKEFTKKSHSFEISPAKITRFSHASTFVRDPSSNASIIYSVHFGVKTNAGKKITLALGPKALMVLARYFVQTNPNTRMCPSQRNPS